MKKVKVVAFFVVFFAPSCDDARQTTHKKHSRRFPVVSYFRVVRGNLFFPYSVVIIISPRVSVCEEK